MRRSPPVLTAASGLLIIGLASCAKNDPAATTKHAPPVVLAPLDPDAGAPLAGSAGSDANGLPTQHIDRAVLRNMLARGQYDELTKLFERLQTDFENDPTRETWPMEAADAFDSAEPTILPRLQAWVTATPESFAPYLARGTHWASVGWGERGAKWFHETPPDDLAAMKVGFGNAKDDLFRALTVRPKLVAAQRRLIQIGRAEGSKQATENAIKDALDACPTCLRVRITYLRSSAPRWGGTYPELLKFIRDAPTTPAMHFLPGFYYLVQARDLLDQNRHDAARAALEKACAIGERWEYLQERAAFLMRHGETSKALADLDRAAALQPGQPDILGDRARVLAMERQYERAANDLRTILVLDPTNGDAKSLLKTVVDGAIWEAGQHREAGRVSDAIRVLDLAAELAPDDPNVKSHRAWTILGDAGAPDAIGPLEDAVKREPNSFVVHQQLDYALAHQRRFDRVVEMWTTYLAAHPSDGRAYFERGGALYNLGRQTEAKADATRACVLGVTAACARAGHL